jgi:hypothetical protein
MLRLKGMWQARIASPDPQPTLYDEFGQRQVANASILFFIRWLLVYGLQEDNVLDRYDRFVITRSDFIWLCPHPPLSVLDRDAIWFPDGEKYGGLTDRHLVVSRADVVNCLNIIEDILLQPIELYEEMKDLPTYMPNGWNIEQFLQHHLLRKGLLHKVKLFPYVMYLARSVRDDGSKTWSQGRYEPAVGHFVKYEKEFRVASAYSQIIHSRADWETGVWRQFEPGLVAHRPDSLARRLRYACERRYYETYYRLRSALRRRGNSGGRRAFPNGCCDGHQKLPEGVDIPFDVSDCARAKGDR